MSSWYYSRAGGKPQGPVSMANLRVMAACGQLGANDLLFEEGAKDWIAAGQVAGLCPGAVSRGIEAMSSEPAGMGAPTGRPAAPVSAAPVEQDPLAALGAVADGGQAASGHHHGREHHRPAPSSTSSTAPIVIGLVIVGAALLGLAIYQMQKQRPTPAPAQSVQAPPAAPPLETRSEAYQTAYKEGLTDGQNLAKQWATLSGADKEDFRTREMDGLNAENDSARQLMSTFEPGSDQVQQVKGHADGLADGMRQGGMSVP